MQVHLCLGLNCFALGVFGTLFILLLTLSSFGCWDIRLMAPASLCCRLPSSYNHLSATSPVLNHLKPNRTKSRWPGPHWRQARRPTASVAVQSDWLFFYFKAPGPHQLSKWVSWCHFVNNNIVKIYSSALLQP